MSDTTVDANIKTNESGARTEPIRNFQLIKGNGADPKSKSTPTVLPISSEVVSTSADDSDEVSHSKYEVKAWLRSLYEPLYPSRNVSRDLNEIANDVMRIIAEGRSSDFLAPELQRNSICQEAEVRRVGKYAVSFTAHVPTFIQTCRYLDRLIDALNERERTSVNDRWFHDRCIRKHDIPDALEWLDNGIKAARKHSWSYAIASRLDDAAKIVVRLRDNGPVI